jgi:hypothetical protein
MQCLSITDNVNEECSRAILKFVPVTSDGGVGTSDYTPQDFLGPTALTPVSKVGWGYPFVTYADELKPGMRVIIFKRDEYDHISGSAGEIYFIGMLMNRIDSSDPDSLTWECVDDKWLLGGKGGINIKGALIYAPDAVNGYDTIQYCSSYLPVFNPDGLANCIGIYGIITSNGSEIYNGLIPVFSKYARRLPNLNSSYAGTLQAGKTCYWTPRLAMNYLRLFLSLNTASEFDDRLITGLDANSWRSIIPSIASGSGKRITFTNETINNWHAWDPVEHSTDLADKMMQTLSVQGKKALAAMNDILRTTSTHGLRMNYSCKYDEPDKEAYSDINFFVKAVSRTYEASQIPSGVTINIKSSGVVGQPDPTPEYDQVSNFSIVDSREDCAESCLVHGQSIILESEFLYDPTSSESAEYQNSQIFPAWKSWQETGFKNIISGCGKGNWFAYMPPALDETSVSDITKWIPCAGQGGNPKIWAYSENAIELARKMFPEVYIAFRIKPTIRQMFGYDDKFEDDVYAKVQSYKTILKEQEQPIISEIETSINKFDTTIVTKFPIRVSVYTTWVNPNNAVQTKSEWCESSANPGLRVDPNGIFYLEGLAEKLDSDENAGLSQERLYEGTLYEPFTEKNFITLKKFKINCAVKLDHRLMGYYDRSSDPDVATWPPAFHNSLYNAIDGYAQAYIDTRDTLREVHQVDSTPAAITKFASADGGTDISAPINRILPPTDGETEAERIAKRRSMWLAQTKFNGSYKIPGIHKRYRAGTWISNLERFGSGYYIPVMAAIQSVTWDFMKPMTEIGGFICDED